MPQVVEQECGPTRDPPQSVSIDIGLRIENDGGPDAADLSHSQSVSEIDNSRNKNVAQEQRPRIVVPVHGRDNALGHSSEPELKAAAHHADKYLALLGVAMTTPCKVGPLAARLQELTRQFSRAAAEESGLRNADNFQLPEETVRRDAKHMGELGSFEALIDYHNEVQT